MTFMKPLFYLACITTCFLTITFSAFGYDLKSAAEDMDNYFLPAYPVVYGEIIDRLPAEEVSNISAALKGVEIFGYLKSMGDVAQKLDSGDSTGAALDSATMLANMAISKFKDEATKKIFIAGVGVGTLPLTALVTTIDITRKSYEAVNASKTALDLERIYYSIQTDPVLKIKGRKLGEGNPIRIDSTTIEHIWRKVLLDDQWRGLFKNYVTGELGRDWPEPTVWEQWTIGGENLQQAKLLEDRNSLKSHIASLLLEMNKVAQKAEARVILAQQLREIEAVAGKISQAELEKALREYNSALKELPAIETYVNGLTDLIARYSARIAKAPATELVTIRETEILFELDNISSKARIVRLLPSVGRNASKRQTFLTKLKKGYVDLLALRTSAGRAEINTRLVAESKKLEVAGTEFTFVRYICTKGFEDVKGEFDSKVVNGAADAGSAVDKAKTDITQIKEKLSADYSKNWVENEKKYQENLAALIEQQRRLVDQLSRTSDYRQKEALQQAIDRLTAQINALNGRFEAYRQLYQLNVGVDTESCQGAIREIDTFVRENSNRQGIVQAALEDVFSDANAKYWNFYTNHQSPCHKILSEDELERLEAIIRDNPDSYAGLSFEFLKKHFVNEKDAPRSRNILQTVTNMSDALMTYSNSLYAYRMPYYSDWEKWTIPSLQYMESAAPRESIKVVLAAIDAAISRLTSTNRSEFSETFKERYDQMLEQLRIMRIGMERDEKLLSKANGLSSSFGAYNDKALRNNSQIAEDSALITPVLRDFWKAKQSLSVTIAMFTAQSKDTPSRVLNSGPLFKIIEDADVLSHSKRLGLGIEELVKEPFLEMQGKNGLVDIYTTDFSKAISKVQSAPVNEYGLFFQKLYAVADEQGGVGIIMGLLLRSGNTFPAIFQDDLKMAEAATKLYKLFIERQEVARKNQGVIDELKARFDMVLNKVNQLIKPMQGDYDSGYYLGVLGRSSFISDVRMEYKAIGSTRQDVDDAFARLDKLVEDSRSKAPTEAPLSSGTPAQLQAVRDLYGRFTEAYAARDDSQIMSLMGDDWEAGDGTTLSDMQVNLSRVFRKFDELKIDVQNMQINPTPEGFIVNYDITITSRIYKKNLRHQEKSAVSELVSFGSNGSPRIVKTLNGRYWLVE